MAMGVIVKPRMDPVFVIGYKRSGTTLFRLMLNAHPDLSVAPESEFFQNIPVYFGIQKYHTREHITKYSKILSALTRSDFGLKLSSDDYASILAAILPCSTEEIIAALYQFWGKVHEKPNARWGDKKPQHWKFVYKLKDLYPDSQFIHITRDPRDAYASIEDYFPGQIIGRKFIPPHIITAWQYSLANKEMMKQSHNLGQDRYMCIKYESLVADPIGMCKKTCAFLGVGYDDCMLNFQKAAQKVTVQGASNSGGAHMNTTKKVHPKRIGRFRDANLSADQINEIQYICKDFKKIFGWGNESTVSSIRTVVLDSMCKVLDNIWALRRSKDRFFGGL